MFVLDSLTETDRMKTVWSTVNMLPVGMPRCVVIERKCTRFHILQSGGLVGTSGPFIPLPLFSTDICLPLHLSLASPLDANTNQHFMCPGAVEWPPLKQPDKTWTLRSDLLPPAASWYVGAVQGLLVAGLSTPILFPTSHASFPLPRATVIARCGGLRNNTQFGELNDILGNF